MPRHAVKPHKAFEKLTSEDYDILSRFIAAGLHADLPKAWTAIAMDRLALAESHLAVAASIQGIGRPGVAGLEKRSVISRAYYAMFCAARAAVSLEAKGDINDHQKVPTVLNKMTTLGPTADRDSVIALLNKFRALRNEADYSAYYPAPLGRDARFALAAARKVLRICRRWVKTTAKDRVT